MLDVNITEEAVSRYLYRLITTKSAGPDKIYPLILKECASILCKPLTVLFNKSLQLSEVPNDWKTANITPIFKKGSKSSPANYRPVSLTSVVGKIMESCLRDAVVEHLEKNGLINDTQHGFRAHRSCLTNLLEFLEDVTLAVDEGKPVDVIYLDFAKAFDKVPHVRLCCKLQSHGVGGKVANWIENWLCNRKQRVVIRGACSNWSSVTSGVPQGSVLGPVLFLIYINDIDTGINSKIKKFADDTKVYRCIATEQDKNELQADLDTLLNWSTTWQMKFNIDKCKVMHIGLKNQKHNYIMSESPLAAVAQEKDIGVIVHESLKPASQCVEAVKKANKTLGLIKRSFSFKSKDIIVSLYK